jgi:hypothetical protein
LIAAPFFPRPLLSPCPRHSLPARKAADRSATWQCRPSVDEAGAPSSFSTAAGRASPCLRLPSLVVPSPWSGSAAEVVCYLLDGMCSNHAPQLLATASNPCRMPPARYIAQPHRRCPFSQHAVVGSRCCYLHPSHSPCSTKMPPRSSTSGGCTLIVAAPCPSTRSPSVSPLAQQPRRLRALSARCLVKPVDSTSSTLAGCLLFLRSPIRDAVETRASRQCHSSRTRVRYKTGRVNHMHAQLKSDPIQVD